MAAIIVPTDFSNNAYDALFYATQLFPEEECHITLVHSFCDELSIRTSRIDIGHNEVLYDQLEEDTYKQFKKLKHKITLGSKDRSFTITNVCGSKPLFKMINYLITQTNAALVVMGTKGASGFHKVFIGSQAVRLVKKSKPIPIILIPETTDVQELNSIAYATDLKINYAKYPLEIIKKIQQAHHAKLHIAHIYKHISPGNTVEYNYRKLKDKLAAVDYETHWISSEKPMQQAMVDFCKEHHINLLILMYHKHSFLREIFKTSFVDKMSFHSEIPLLILPEVT